MGTSASSWSTRAFRRLLSLYPGEFRDEYGRELALVFADRYRDAPSAWRRAQVWVEAIGGVVREAPREHLHVLSQDVRYAVRVLLRTPGFFVTALLTLALGIGANTAIFELINALALRPLPIPHPEQLAEIRIQGGNQGFGINPGPYGQLTRPVWDELRTHQEAFSGVFAWSARDLRLGQIPDLQRASGIAVSGEFFRVLGVQPWRGRLLGPEDETACPTSRAVISHALWQSRFGDRDPGNLRLTINGEPHEIVGVMPAEFFGLAVGEHADIALPLCRPANVRRELFELTVMGRLKQGWTIDRGSAHLDALSGGIFEASVPAGYSTKSTERFKSFRLAAYPSPSGVSWLRTQYDTPLKLLLAISGLVLMIACANLANLTIARATARAREVAVRLALGASRARLVRQFVAESCVVASAGAIGAIGVARVLSRVLVWALATDSGSPVLPIAVDWRVLVFTCLIAAGTCLVFGIAPAVRSTRIEPSEAMKSGGRGLTGSRERLNVQRLMVITQLTVSLVLLVAALLFVRSFRNLMTFDPGMRLDGISFAFVGFPTRQLPPEQINDFQRQLIADVRDVPGVRGAGTTSNIPLFGGSWTHGIQIGNQQGPSKFTWVSPGYFETMGIPVVQGRDFSWHDTRNSARVAVVNETFVRRFVPDGHAIGRTLRTGAEPNYPSTVYEIVGIIPDTQYNSLRSERFPMTFAPDSQHPSLGRWTAMMIHSTIEPAAAVAAVKRHLAERHPDVVVEGGIFKTAIHDGLVRERLLAILAGFFGALAAVLAMVGLYGLIACAAAERRREIGIRIALGAARQRVVGMMMLESAKLLAAGLAIGIGASLLAAPAAATLLFGLNPHDVTTLVVAGSLLTAVTCVASFVPARHASRQDPLVALRQE